MVAYQVKSVIDPLLKPYIEHYVSVKFQSDQVLSKTLMPRPGASWLFMNHPFCVENQQFSSHCLVGIRDQPCELKWQSSQMEGLAVKFTPIGIHQFLKTPPGKIKNRFCDQAAVWKNGGQLPQLIEDIRESQSVSEKISFLETFFSKSILSFEYSDKYLHQIIHHLTENPSEELSQLKNKFPTSSRQLERKFKITVGVNMQTFARICRFERAKTDLLKQNTEKLTVLGYDAGYFDQAHFSREFKRLSSLSPKNFPINHPFYQLLAQQQ